MDVIERGVAAACQDFGDERSRFVRNRLHKANAVNIGEGNSRVLTISLSGLKKYEGLDLDVNYQIYPGDEPFIAKWFMFTSHRQSRSV